MNGEFGYGPRHTHLDHTYLDFDPAYTTDGRGGTWIERHQVKLFLGVTILVVLLTLGYAL